MFVEDFFEMNKIFGFTLCFFLVHGTMVPSAAPDQRHRIRSSAYPLHAAAYYGKTDEIDDLLNGGADINEQNTDEIFRTGVYRNGQTPLHVAAARGHLKAAQLLIGRGAKIDLADMVGQTPLFYACQEEIVQLLLARGARVDTRDTFGNTLLHYADDRKIAERLVRAGAEVNATNNGGKTPLHRAVGSAAYDGNKDMVFWFIAHGADVDYQVFENGFTALHSAAFNGNKVMAKTLLAAGANPNKADNKGNTPLQIAQEYYKDNIVRLLQLWTGFIKALRPSLIAFAAAKHPNCGRTSALKMVPLDIINKISLLSTCMYNTQEMELFVANCSKDCSTCFTKFPPDQIVQLHCKHAFCKGCLLFLLETAIKMRKAQGLYCPQIDCEGTLQQPSSALTPEDIWAITEGHNKAQQLRDACLLLKDHDSLCNNPEVRRCPTADCLNMWEFKHEEGYPDAQAYRCDCGYKYCRNCCVPWSDHKQEKRVLACDVAKKHYERRDTSEGRADRLAREMTLAKDGFYCINNACHNMIVQLGGCDKMVCGRDAHGEVQMDGCGHVFCKRCLLPWEGHEVAYWGGRCLDALRLYVQSGNKWAVALQHWLTEDSSRNVAGDDLGNGGGRDYWRQLCRDYGYENAVAYVQHGVPLPQK